MKRDLDPGRVAVVGTGIAGATVAHRLATAGHAVQAFDKARGPGGRMATRRARWLDTRGQPRETRFDHGVPAFAARSPAFRAVVDEARHAGLLTRWAPAFAAGSQPLEGDHFVCVPDMPRWCRQLLAPCSLHLGAAVDTLDRADDGWRLLSGGEVVGHGFDHVIVAMPPAQAAPMLATHRRDWAQHAALALMQPCWTLMGVSAPPAAAAARWPAAHPPEGTLAWVARNDLRPDREQRPDEAHWVAHARAGWSRRHLEDNAESVQAALQAALAELVGEPLRWHFATVHRWRYATPQTLATEPGGEAWWDATLGLGVCGDFLGSGGVEGAWWSATALADAVLGAAPAHPTTAG